MATMDDPLDYFSLVSGGSQYARTYYNNVNVMIRQGKDDTEILAFIKSAVQGDEKLKREAYESTDLYKSGWRPDGNGGLVKTTVLS